MLNIIRYDEEQLKAAADKYMESGFLPGDYICGCSGCDKKFIGAKRSFRCLECAQKAHNRRMVENQLRTVTGSFLQSGAIPDGWKEDPMVVVERPIGLCIWYESPCKFWVTNCEGYEEISGTLDECIEYVKETEECLQNILSKLGK